MEAFTKHIKDIDIIEGFNGRAAFQNKSKQALRLAKEHDIVIAASSDAHGYAGLGTHTVVAEEPTCKNLVAQLQESNPAVKRPSLRGVLYPKYHLVRKFSKRSKN